MVTAFAIFIKIPQNFLINTTYLSASLLCKKSGKTERREIYFFLQNYCTFKKMQYICNIQ